MTGYLSLTVLGLSPDYWTAIAALGQVLAAIASLAGLGFALWTIWHSKKTLQLQMLESIMHDIRDLEFRFNLEYKGRSDADKRLWDAEFFNTVEYFSFLLNNKLISDERVLHFFGDAIIQWYEGMYVRNFPPEHVANVGRLSEFKKLYTNLKGTDASAKGLAAGATS